MLIQEFLSGLSVTTVTEAMSRGSPVETISHSNRWLHGYMRSVLAVGEHLEVSGTILGLHEKALIALVGNFLAHVATSQSAISCLYCDARTLERIKSKNDSKQIAQEPSHTIEASYVILGDILAANRDEQLNDWLLSGRSPTKLLLAGGAHSDVNALINLVENWPVAQRSFDICGEQITIGLIGSMSP